MNICFIKILAEELSTLGAGWGSKALKLEFQILSL